jgi:hypothetical protein
MKDILLSDELDVSFTNGDFSTGESNSQNEQLLLLLQKGSIKTLPLVGVGIQDYVNDVDIDAMIREVRHQFGLDGMKVNSISWDSEKMELDYDANYNS